MAKEATSGGMEGVGVGDFAAPGLELIGAFTDKDATFGAKGSAIGGGIGAGLGAALGGPAGAAIGKALGNTVGQLIGGAKDKRLATERMSSTMNRKYGQLNLAYNANPYGSGSTFYAEDGLVLPGVGDKVQVNIEKDELLVDPSKMEVLQKFDSKRYKRHAKDKSQEHKGNFIEMDASHVIIPRKKADAFKNGDRIARRSIIAQIMEDQEKNGIETNQGVQYAEKGKGPDFTKMTKDEIAAQQQYLISKGAKIDFGKGDKNLGVYGPQTKAALKKYGAMPNQITGQLAPTPSFTDMQEFANYTPAANRIPMGAIDYTAALNPEFDASANLEDILAKKDMGPIAIPRNVKTGKMQIPSNAKFIEPEVADEFKSRKPTFLEKTGLANIELPEVNKMKAARAMNFLPTAVGLIQAGQDDPFLEYDDNGQLDAAKAMIQQMPIDENTEAARAAVAQGQSSYLKAMRNVNSPSTRAEVADFMLKSQGQAGLIEQDKENRRVQRVTQKLGMLADMEQKQGADRLQARNKFALESSQDRAARQGLIHSAISEGAVNFGKSVMDEERIDLANSMLKYNKVNVGGGANVINEDSDAVNTAIANVGILPGPMATSYQVPSIPGVSRGVPLVNGSAALPGIGATRTSKPRVGAPATAKRILGS